MNKTKIYGTLHPPHGWLPINCDFGDIAPTIDATIHYWHTLVIEIMEIEEMKQYCGTLAVHNSKTFGCGYTKGLCKTLRAEKFDASVVEIDTMNDENKILRAEQSRAEQSRACLRSSSNEGRKDTMQDWWNSRSSVSGQQNEKGQSNRHGKHITDIDNGEYP